MSMNLPLSIFESELHVIVHECELHPDIETGGALFGLWTQTGAPVVMLATRSGQNAVHEVTHFRQDEVEHGLVRDLLWNECSLQWIGLWHSHHQLGLEELSRGDVSRTMHLAQHHNIERFAEILCFWHGHRPTRGETLRVNVKPFVYLSATRGVTAPCEIRLLSGFSPIRAMVTKRRNVASLRNSARRANYTCLTSRPLLVGNLAREDGAGRVPALPFRPLSNDRNCSVSIYDAHGRMSVLSETDRDQARIEDSQMDDDSPAPPEASEKLQGYLLSRVIPGLHQRWGSRVGLDLTELDNGTAEILISLEDCQIRIEADCQSMKPTRCEMSYSKAIVSTYAKDIDQCVREAACCLPR